MYKRLTSSRGSDVLSFSFDRDRNRRQRELTKNKIRKGKDHVRILLREIIGVCEHLEKGTFGLSFRLP